LLDGLVHPVMTAMDEFARDAESGALSNGEIVSRFLDLTIDGFPGVFPLMIDPGARLAIKTRYDLQEPIRRIEAALAGGTDPDRVLGAQFILGGIRSMVVSRLLAVRQARCAAGEQLTLADIALAEDAPPLLDEAECAVVVRTALAGLAALA
jgi:hypothetical protein